MDIIFNTIFATSFLSLYCSIVSYHLIDSILDILNDKVKNNQISNRYEKQPKNLNQIDESSLFYTIEHFLNFEPAHLD